MSSALPGRVKAELRRAESVDRMWIGDINPLVEPTKALNEAKSVRRLIGVMWTFYVVALIAYSNLGPLNFVSMACLAVVGVLLILNAVLLVRWRVRYPAAAASGDEGKQAKRTWNISLVFWIIMALLGLVPFLLSIFFPVKPAIH